MTVYIKVKTANTKLALLGLFQVRIIAIMIINPGKKAPKKLHTLKPGFKSNNMVKKNNPTISARTRGA